MGTRQTKSESPSGRVQREHRADVQYLSDMERTGVGCRMGPRAVRRGPGAYRKIFLLSQNNIYTGNTTHPDRTLRTGRSGQRRTGGRLCVCHSNLVENTRTDAGARPPPDLDHRERTPLLQFCDMIVRHARLARSRNAHSIQAAGTHRAARRRALSITHAALARAPKAMRCVWSVCHAVASPRPRTTQPPSRNPQT